MKSQDLTFKDYWPQYVAHHSRVLTQQLHFWSLTLYFLSWPFSFFTGLWWSIPATLVVGYLLAYFTHRFIEKSPFNVKHPFWGIVANLYMFWLILTFRMKEEMTRLGH